MERRIDGCVDEREKETERRRDDDMGCCIYEIGARGEQVGQAKQTIICICKVCKKREREKKTGEGSGSQKEDTTASEGMIYMGKRGREVIEAKT